MTRGTQRRSGRPRTAVLDRDRIGAAALALVDETGDFTLPEVAQRLGVRTASLYHHVDGRAGVVELLREQVKNEMDMTALDDPSWRTAITGFVRSYRAAFAQHPRVVLLLATTTVRSPAVLAAYDKLVGHLTGNGIPPERAMTILTAVDNFVIGSALDLAAPRRMWEIPEGVQAPHLAAALRACDDIDRHSEEAFERGLSHLLAGIAEEITTHRQD
ncbi:TetR/AcrR family transcriptional regulator C-terminal domain-containing protein [Salinifilum aidingensis]